MRQRSRRGWTVAAGAAAILAGLPAPSPAADLAVRYATFLSPGGAGALHLSLGLPAGDDLGIVFDAARFSGNVYLLAGGVRTLGRHRPGPNLYAQVLAGVAFEPGGSPVAIVQPGMGVDLGSRGPAAFRLQVDWPLVTFNGLIYLVPRVSAGVVFRPEP